MKKEIIALIVAAIVIVAVVAIVIYQQNKPEESNRPEYCIEDQCVPDRVFEKLPAMPKDFPDKWGLVYYGRISNLSKIDENIWKQPEFYATTFQDQCLPYYVALADEDAQVPFNSAGSGPYPGDVGITNVTPGEDIEAVAFWHASCGVARYQAMSLMPTFPEEMVVRMTKIKVNQDPWTAAKCFNIRITPDTILLEPSFPQYQYNYTQLVKAEIHVNDDCPAGEYGIHLIPMDPPKEVIEDLEFKYGWAMSSMRVGGAWQIYVVVV